MRFYFYTVQTIRHPSEIGQRLQIRADRRMSGEQRSERKGAKKSKYRKTVLPDEMLSALH